MKSANIFIMVLILLASIVGCKEEERIIGVPNNIDTVVYGKIYCESYPSGAKIFIDSVFTGRFTPAVIDSIAEGIHLIELKKYLFFPFESAVQVRFGTIPAIRCTLKQSVNTSTYFPLTVGSSWYYQRSDTGQSRAIDTASIAISNIDSTLFNKMIGGLWIEKYREHGQLYIDSMIAVVRNDSINIWQKTYSNPPQRTFCFPLKTGKTWKISYNEYQVDTIETVNSLAGTFTNCYKVRHVVTIPNTYGWTWYWIHPQKGIVKIYDFDGLEKRYRVWSLMSYHIE